MLYKDVIGLAEMLELSSSILVSGIFVRVRLQGELDSKQMLSNIQKTESVSEDPYLSVNCLHFFERGTLQMNPNASIPCC